MTPRAPALTPDERRRALIEATLPLVLDHGRSVTTRQIAEAAGVAEGTIFRVFATKDDLVDAAVAEAFDMEPYVRAVETLDRAGSLDEVVTRAAQVMLDRFQHVFRLLAVLGHDGVPRKQHPQGWRERIGAAHRELLAAYAEELRVTPRELMRYVRLLAFGSTNPHVNDGPPLTAADITALVLDGARKDR